MRRSGRVCTVTKLELCFIRRTFSDEIAVLHDGRHDRLTNMTFGKPSSAAQRARATRRLTALGEMTGGIAHDFRSLLAAIESGLRLAEKNSGQPEKARSYIAMIREEIDRGLELTSQLLAFAKQQELHPQVGDANEFLKNLEVFMKYSAGPDIRISLVLAPNLPKCLLDPAQLHSAVLNLIVNARDAMLNGGDIQITTDSCSAETVNLEPHISDTYVCVRVKDNGRGMSADVLSKVFDPLFTTKGENGTGLGLSQVYAFMHLMHGHARITSKEGIGTTVDLLFPSGKAFRKSTSAAKA